MNKRAAILSFIFTSLILIMVTGVVNISLNSRNRVSASGSAAGGQTTLSTAQPVMETSSPKISAQQASQIALQYAGPGESLVSTPEEVLFNGDVAYEVKTQDGNTLYISANDGSLKFNSITGTNIPVASPDAAVQTASTYISNNQPVAISWANYQNQMVYAVGFANGSVVLVNRSGNVVAAQVAQ
jgi:hypothetical protein